MESLTNRVVEEFKKYAAQSNLRCGQKWMLALSDADPEKYRDLTLWHRDFDCFYDNRKLPMFFHFLSLFD